MEVTGVTAQLIPSPWENPFGVTSLPSGRIGPSWRFIPHVRGPLRRAWLAVADRGDRVHAGVRLVDRRHPLHPQQQHRHRREAVERAWLGPGRADRTPWRSRLSAGRAARRLSLLLPAAIP